MADEDADPVVFERSGHPLPAAGPVDGGHDRHPGLGVLRGGGRRPMIGRSDAGPMIGRSDAGPMTVANEVDR